MTGKIKFCCDHCGHHQLLTDWQTCVYCSKPIEESLRSSNAVQSSRNRSSSKKKTECGKILKEHLTRSAALAHLKALLSNVKD